MFLLIIVAATLVAGYALLHGHSIDVLQPAGEIAHKQRNLMIFGSLLSLLIIVPVFALTIGIVWKYRESNTRARYTPNWDHNRKIEAIWWTLPTILIIILGIVTVKSSHDLDPFKPLTSSVKPIRVQVVALDWKWLFIYPDEHIATVNYLKFPVNTPVNFELTADAPMNSFWIPKLGGQIYAMSGMTTHLHLMADKSGNYDGVSANISGEGFAGMRFTAQATSQGDYENWVGISQTSKNSLNAYEYERLVKQSINNPKTTYSLGDQTLYDTVVMKYMPMSSMHEGMSMEGM